MKKVYRYVYTFELFKNAKYKPALHFFENQ